MNGISGDASNIRVGSNPPFVLSDFFDQYPQFGPNEDGDYLIVPTLITQMFIDLAHESIQEARWRSHWKIAMGWFVAHFLTMYLQGVADPNGGAAAVIAAGQAKGLNVSESVGDVSVSTDFSTIAQDLDGWAAWKLTIYGQQLATIGKLVGRGGMYVY
ncbi:DUF4054 domain-containing protein [Paenibacillus sp. 2RAB27]|uniref:DUF4054 domain-containing protein n=1 Tax=Paenibacillus sp. 2RAB27 TaxID=3232991 RepID=UPI003F9BBB5E